jgi:hypothetical protein
MWQVRPHPYFDRRNRFDEIGQNRLVSRGIEIARVRIWLETRPNQTATWTLKPTQHWTLRGQCRRGPIRWKL